MGGALLDVTAFKWIGRMVLSWRERASLVLGGAILDLTAFKWIGRVDLSWAEGKSCFGWGSLRFNSLRMDWESGLVLKRRASLVLGGAVLDIT